MVFRIFISNSNGKGKIKNEQASIFRPVNTKN